MTHLTDAWFQRIKAAQRDLIKYCGGIERVVELSGFSKSQVGRWNLSTETDLMPLNAVFKLENECGVLCVTSVMASLNNRRLAEPDEVMQAAGNLLAAHSDVVVSVGEIMSVGARVFADGKVTGTEALQLDKAADNAERNLTSFRRELSSHVANARRGDPALYVIGEK
ncbi:phage regulatory CII family protein [Brucella sp. NBRC 113783]|uniref:phage regulatory CII family protein n=1 Tax=Brucella sp. NBRC 113783 TaxID=3075478 RepID=UPI0029BFD423|nr:phage regulatory CII family protein [Brucella sp. NBRC 113783]MDX4074801.1 phage regulatory CII family protein [Brucella sp. NBRC 113783]